MTDSKGDTITEADRFVLSMFYGNLQFFLRNPPAGLSADTEMGLDVALLRPTPEQYATGRRLHLGHPILWTASQALEAERCTGCLVSVNGKTRHVHAVDGCPVHSSDLSVLFGSGDVEVPQ